MLFGASFDARDRLLFGMWILNTSVHTRFGFGAEVGDGTVLQPGTDFKPVVTISIFEDFYVSRFRKAAKSPPFALYHVLVTQSDTEVRSPRSIYGTVWNASKIHDQLHHHCFYVNEAYLIYKIRKIQKFKSVETEILQNLVSRFQDFSNQISQRSQRNK